MKILTNAFYIYQTHGLPLSMQMDIAKEKGIGVSLPLIMADALISGMSYDKAWVLIREALADSDTPQEEIANVEAAFKMLLMPFLKGRTFKEIGLALKEKLRESSLPQ